MQLQYDTLDSVPEDLREEFVEFKDGDKSVFMHKDLHAAKLESFRFKGDLTQTQQKQKELAEQLKSFQDAEAERKRLADEAELEDKRKKGQHEEILEDFKTKAQQREEALKAELDELRNGMRAKEKSAVVADLATVGTEATRATLKRLIDSDLAFGEDGSLVVMENGKATSTTLDEYKAKLKDLYPALVSGSHGNGGFGHGGNGSVPVTTPKRSNATQAYKANLK